MRRNFSPEGQSLNKEYYLEVMRRFDKAIREKTEEFVGKKLVDRTMP